MTVFQTVLSEIFDQGAEIRMSVAEEAVAIEQAKAGEERGLIALVFAYSPALRNAVGRYRAALGAEDARSLAVEGLLKTVHAFDPAKGVRLAGLVADTVARTLSEASMGEVSWAIPERTLSRFYSILRGADGDVEEALTVAGEKGMSREIFLNILTALRQTDSLDTETTRGPQKWGADNNVPATDLDARPLWDDANPFAAAEDRLMVEIAFGAVDELEQDITRHAYGFETGDPKSDATVGPTLSVRDLGEEATAAGQTSISRPKVQRTRASALGKMRTALVE